MGGVQSTSSVALPRSVAVEMPNQVLAHATSIDLTAAIDPTTVADSAYGSTVYLTSTVVVPAAPTASGPPHFVFSYGDSYTANGFNIHGNKPSLENNEGNAIGTTAGGNSQPNWIEILVNNGPVNSLSYDFAYGGAAVDNKLTKGVNHIIPDFVSQSQSFLQNLAMTPHPSWAQWSGNNSLFVTWFGRNDVYWQIIQGDPVSPRLDNVIRAYFDILTGLYASGARKFLVLGIPRKITPRKLHLVPGLTHTQRSGESRYGSPSRNMHPRSSLLPTTGTLHSKRSSRPGRRPILSPA